MAAEDVHGQPLGGPAALSLIVFSGGFERVHYALALAAAAAAIDKPATLFFTMEAIAALRAADADAVPGWRRLAATTAPCGGDADDRFAALGVATFEDLLAACIAMGVRFIVCEMGLRALGLGRNDLRADVPLVEAGLVTLLADSAPGTSPILI